MPDARIVKGADLLGYLLGAAERGIALGGTAEIHRIAMAQCCRRRVERLLIAGVESREQQMAGAEAFDRAPGRFSSGGNLGEPGAVSLRRHDIGDPAISQ